MHKVTSSVVSKDGVQFLTVNGQRIDSVAYITYLPENNRYEDFAKAGYSLFSTCVFFGSNCLKKPSTVDPQGDDLPGWSDIGGVQQGASVPHAC